MSKPRQVLSTYLFATIFLPSRNSARRSRPDQSGFWSAVPMQSGCPFQRPRPFRPLHLLRSARLTLTISSASAASSFCHHLFAFSVRSPSYFILHNFIFPHTNYSRSPNLPTAACRRAPRVRPHRFRSTPGRACDRGKRGLNPPARPGEQ